MLELAQPTSLLQESNSLSRGVAWRNWPQELPIKASVMGFPNDKCQCPQEQNIIKDRVWCGFGALICAWAGKHNFHFTSALLLHCILLLAVESMQVLDCLVPFFLFPPLLWIKKKAQFWYANPALARQFLLEEFNTHVPGMLEHCVQFTPPSCSFPDVA